MVEVRVENVQVKIPSAPPLTMYMSARDPTRILFLKLSGVTRPRRSRDTPERLVIKSFTSSVPASTSEIVCSTLVLWRRGLCPQTNTKATPTDPRMVPSKVVVHGKSDVENVREFRLGSDATLAKKVMSG